ncbi:GGDEF domain-containing protein [Rhodopseudomonas sp. P2A-2r]|uniref:GGDEF domain-containing protein n=1 Tax=unclassified Rhodopseudomonas TaxID=2638247 RepID=UPI002233F06E|nr:GGDEF domain-containing protein [Rhodopseudomonas sp. P2A-2r]UZE47678.1 GGDEF domain-containing protein [Rhodopseudomonas sp. P2A-2r]
MPTAHHILQNAVDGGVETAPAVLTPDVLRRRTHRRRHLLEMIAASYLVDVVLLLLYAAAGTVPASVAAAYAACGAAFVAVFGTMSETGFNDRFRDHYLVCPQAIAGSLQIMAFIYLAPEVGALFICTQFIVISFSSLRTTLPQSAALWTLVGGGLAALFLIDDLRVGLPHGTLFERLVTVLMLATTTGRCMFIGIFASSQRASLYRRGVELTVANRKIEELAELDELTGSFNRRCIMRMLDDEIGRAQRIGVPCCVALIDLDWFKRINDTYGHPTGDEVLRTFAITVYANIRSSDRFGRYGGEEFLLVLPDTPHETAVQILDRLRALITVLDWSAFSDGMSVTISAGIARLDPDDTADTLLARADRALYAAKKQGRNRIASA